MVDGTITRRTMVVSRMMAMERPTPNSLMIGSGCSRKLKKTVTMMTAAAVITRALVPTPVRTAWLGSWPWP